MKNCSLLFRSPSCRDSFYRKRSSAVNMIRRKQLRRLQKMNYYHKDFTGQQNQNVWFTPKKLKALGLFMEQSRNLHRGSKPIPENIRKQLGQRFTEDSHWQYYMYRNEIEQYKQEQKANKQNNIEQAINQLTFILRKQLILDKDRDIPPQPQMCQYQFLYTEQYELYLADQDKYRQNLMLRLLNPPKDKNIEEEGQ